MWIVLAIISAISAGFVSVTVKVGMKNIDSNLGTFLRTLVVLVFTLIMTLIVGGFADISNISSIEWAYIIGSGLCTGFSWLCYFKALQIGENNKVAAVDKLSTVLTMLFAIIILGESFWWLTFVAMALMIFGSMLMINKKKAQITKNKNNNVKASNKWFIFALLSLVFASLTAILAKIGMQGINSQLGTFLRTIVVAIMAFLIVLFRKKLSGTFSMTKFNWLFLIFSGILTGISWLCYYVAIQIGVVSVIVPIDKLSIIITVIFCALILKENISVEAWIGLTILTCGTLLLLI